jgi:hypothetical protein
MFGGALEPRGDFGLRITRNKKYLEFNFIRIYLRPKIQNFLRPPFGGSPSDLGAKFCITLNFFKI